MAMDRPQIYTKAFKRGYSMQTMDALLHCLYQIDVACLQTNEVPLVYESGVRYRLEPLGEEKWTDPLVTIERGIGDCEDLACWRSAELFVKNGVQAHPVFRLRQHTTTAGVLSVYHILVRYPDGTMEDPSYILGMRPAFNPASPERWRD